MWRSPGAWAHSLRRAAAAHGPFTMAFSTSLQACWHLIVQDVPGLGGPAVMLSLSNRASMAPYLRESSTCGKLVSLPTSLASTLLSTISPQCCLCYHYCISHPNPPPETTCGLASHPERGTSSQAASQQATQWSPVVLQPQNTLWLLLSAET